jgi:hypothetical protein
MQQKQWEKMALWSVTSDAFLLLHNIACTAFLGETRIPEPYSSFACKLSKLFLDNRFFFHFHLPFVVKTGFGVDEEAVPSLRCFLVLATIWLTFIIYPSTLNLRLHPARFMYLIFPNTGRSFQPCVNGITRNPTTPKETNEL